MLSEVELRAHEAIIERLLYSHLAQEHLLCLSPLELLKLRGAIQFGAQARRALDIIGRRQQDYLASLRSAPWHMALMPLGAAQAKQPIGKRYYTRPEDAHKWLARRPYLYVENASADGAVLTLLVKAALPLLGSSSELVVIRLMHGGGNTIGSVLEDNVDQFTIGMCVCDRDTTAFIPPFPVGSTGASAHSALIKKGMVPDGSNALQTKHPFFHFVATEGWGIENTVGPKALELFFEQADECREARRALMEAFPTFPQLSDSERKEWNLVNLKSASQRPEVIRQGASALPDAVAVSEERAEQLAVLTIPGSVIPFVKEASLSGRYHKPLLAAVKADLGLPGYGDSIRAMAERALTAFAADSRINFA